MLFQKKHFAIMSDVFAQNILFDNYFKKPTLEELLSSKYKRIIDKDKLHIGSLYLMEWKSLFSCGKLIKKQDDDKFGLSIYFLVGNAYYGTNILQEQVHQYHIQSSNLLNIIINFYDYPLDYAIQQQIKYAKYVKALAVSKNIPNELERIILSYL